MASVVYRQSSVVHYPSSVVHPLSSVAHGSSFVARRLPFATRCLLFANSLFAVHQSLFAARHSPFAMRRSPFAAGRGWDQMGASKGSNGRCGIWAELNDSLRRSAQLMVLNGWWYILGVAAQNALAASVLASPTSQLVLSGIWPPLPDLTDLLDGQRCRGWHANSYAYEFRTRTNLATAAGPH